MSPLNPISTSASAVQSRSFTSLGEEQREPTKVSVSKEAANPPDNDLGHQTPQVDSRRRIHFGPAAANNVQGRGGSNAVATAKYELWNIVPKNLFEQFQRAANIWFLIVSICQMLPLDLSPTSKYATLVPLAFVLSITFCKDAYEDYGRRRDDSRVNNERCNAVDPNVMHASKLHEMRWKDVAVGMYLQLGRDEKVPADMVLIACSNEDGVAYVDTAQLDGETSLKPKFVLEETTRVSTSRELLALEGHLDAELPNQLVQSFHGTLHLRGYPRAVPLDIKNLLLRGSTLRNTAWVYGLVVYTGYDTKLVQNLKKTPSKRSRVEVTSNYLLIIVFTFLCFCAMFAATLRAIMLREGSDSARNLAWVWPEKDPLRDNSYLAFITFMIGYNNLIPISLYVTTDLVRSFQALLMEWDRNMYHHETDSGCRVKNSSLNENLGQVEFVLTDKTGTLTENHMQFKACAVQNRVYGCWDEETGAKDDVVRVPPAAVCKPLAGAPLRKAKEAGDAHKKVEIEQEEAELLDHFFMCLATCHTAIVEKSMRKVKSLSQRDQQQRRTFESGSLKTSYLSSEATDADTQNLLSGGSEGAEVSREAEEAEFRSSSPDEEALLAAARDYGFFFRRKSASRLTVNVRGKDVFFNVLICNEFSSDRKRMSVLVRRSDEFGPEVSSGSNTQCATRDSPGCARSKSFPLDPVSDNATETEQPSLNEQPDIGRSAVSGPLLEAPNQHPVVLYVKGADNVMLERISKKDAGDLGITRKRLEQFSKEGLRTLVCAKRELTTAEAESFCWKMQEAKTAFLNRNLMVEKVADEMERDLDILGVTAIEDRIQRGVPETVNMLLRAGVKVWMLTGDNMETSFNVGVACKLIDPAMRKYKLEPGVGGLVDTDPSSVQQMLAAFYNHISRELKAERKPGDFKYCLALHGKVLYTILDEAQATLRQLFLQIACSSSAVIACRLAPAQKAALVQLVRNGIAGSPLTLAIGDGGNDVSMIQEAHVGVGLLGVEGRQAANAADYVIGQFRFLQSLLFVHGRWNLRRIGLVIGYSFCKNFLLVCPLVHFGRYSGFSGTTLYESYLLSTFNLVFTSLPIVSVGVLDTDVTASMALLVPSLYQMGIQQRYFNAHMLLGWMLRGVIHAELTMVVMWVCFSGSLATSEVPGGLVPDYFTMGSWAYWTCVVVANLILMLHAKAWMDWQVLMVLGSILMFLLCLALYSDGNFILASTFQVNMVGVATALFGHMRSWMGLLFVAATSVFGESALSLLKKELAPDPSDVLQEIQSGLVTGKACSGATQEQRQAEAIEYLKTLPPSMPRVMRPKPEGRVSLRPFPSHCQRRKWPQATVLPDAHSVVPVESDPIDFKGERTVHDSAIIILPASYTERLWQMLSDIVNTLYRMQWSEMAVGELCCTLEYDRAGMSGYFKSPSLSTSSAPFRCDRHADESPTLQGSPTDLAKQGTSSSFAMRERDNRDPSLLAEPASPTSPTSPTSPRSHSIASQITSDSKEVIKDLMYSIVTLRFFSVSQERDFSRFLTRQAIQLFGKSLLASFFVLFLFNLFSLAAKPGSDTAVRIVICVGVVPCCLATRCWLRTGACDRHAEPLITTFVIAIIVAKHFYDIVTHNNGILLNSYLPLFIFAGTLIRFPFAVLVLLSHLLGILVHYWLLADSLVVVYAADATETVLQRPPEEYWVLMLGIAALATYYCYQLEKLMRRDFFVLDSIWKSKHQALEILKNMFPEGVVEHVVAQIGQDQRNKEGATGTPAARALREDRGIITIIFCDICDFDGLVEILLPHELVQLLDMVWMMFDHICDMHGVVKIETVSKTYMAAAMPEDPSLTTTKRQATDAANAVLTAIGMLEHVSRRFTGTGKVTKVSVRIGIHTGRAISGVVGSQKPQFALFGDTVNTASRMQSTGKRNCLHISGATHELIAEDQRFEWETRQTQVKGKGDMTTYLLKRHRLTGHSRHGSKVPRQRPSTTATTPAAQGATQTPSLTTLDILPGCNRIAEASDEAAQHNLSNDSSGKQGVDSTAADTVSSSLPEGPRVATLDRLEQRGKAMAYFRQVSVSSSWGRGGSSRRSGWRRFLPGLGNCLINLLEKLACNNHHAQRLSKVGGSPMKPQWVSFVSFLVTFAIESLALIHAMQEVGMVELVLLRWAYVAFSLLVAFLLYRIGKRQKWGTKRTEGLAFCDLIALTVFAGFACSFIANMAVSRDPETEVENWMVFEGFFYVMVLLHFSRLHPQGLVPVFLCVLVILTIIIWVWSRDDGMLPECAAYTVFVCVTHWIAMVGDPRWAFSEQKAMCEDHERVSGLLDSMLPREVLSEMKSGSLSLAYQYENMTLLFADIVGFTRYCSEHTAEQAVNLVTRLFADFDEHAVQLGVYKVCTIGDAYVAVNEPRTAAADKFADCESVYRMGKFVLQCIGRVRAELQHNDLDMRIGLHYGKFVGGVIGTKRVRFDIWGEDVLIGNNVESHGHAGCICVSEAAKEVLECTTLMPLTFTFNVDIELKNGRKVSTYICKPRTESSEPEPAQHAFSPL